MDRSANRYINPRVCEGRDDHSERIMAFIQDCPARKALVGRMVIERASYKAHLEQIHATADHPEEDVAVAARNGK